jgi:hypothetical protein
MKLKINDTRKIFSIQKEFNASYPFLKLEFFSKPHRSAGPSSKKYIKSNSLSLAECRTVNKNGTITVSPNMTVYELEQHFQDVFGLNVQVFRKSGKVWLETTVTDNWTLEKQNAEGEELSKIAG